MSIVNKLHLSLLYIIKLAKHLVFLYSFNIIIRNIREFIKLNENKNTALVWSESR